MNSNNLFIRPSFIVNHILFVVREARRRRKKSDN